MHSWGLRYGELIERRARRQPGRVAVICDDAVLTYAQFAANIVAASKHLSARGVSRGDRVVCVSGNRPEVLETVYACSRLGAVFVPVNPGATRQELEYVLDDAHPAAACVESADTDAWRVLVDAGIAVLGFDEPGDDLGGAPDVRVEVDAEDPAIISYTSGTTGSPKGVVLSHGALHWNSVNTLLGLDIVSDDVALINTPLFHIAGLNVLTVNTLYKGGTIVLARSFDPVRCLALVQEHHVSTMFAVPTMLTRLERTPALATADLSSLRWILGGGAPFAPEMVSAWFDRGVPVIASFGLTEAGPSVSFRRPDDLRAKSSSSGSPAPLTDLQVVDADGVPVPAGHVGELVVSGPHVASGYWNKPEATAETFRPDGLHTGDRGFLDEDGDVVIVGRAKETIITGGENVDPVEVEHVIAQHPAVVEAVVVGVPDETWGERVAVVVVPAEGAHLDLDELRAFAARFLARYKLPRQIELWDAIPKTSIGKIRRVDVQAALHPVPAADVDLRSGIRPGC